MPDEIVVSRQAALVTISLNRPAKLNAFNRSMRAALTDALQTAADDASIRAVVLRGEGPGFCAGQDLADVPDDVDLGALLEQEYAPIIRLIRTMPKPVLATVHGVAAGAGANLALACDLVVAAESARFIQAFIRIGLAPDVGGTWFLPRLVGSARARALAMLGLPVSGQDAAAWGMIWRAVPDDRLVAETDVLAATLAALPTLAIAGIKRALDAESATVDQQLTLESEIQGELGRSSDFAEGRRAFLEKRPPRFTGRAG